MECELPKIVKKTRSRHQALSHQPKHLTCFQKLLCSAFVINNNGQKANEEVEATDALLAGADHQLMCGQKTKMLTFACTKCVVEFVDGKGNKTT